MSNELMLNISYFLIGKLCTISLVNEQI